MSEGLLARVSRLLRPDGDGRDRLDDLAPDLAGGDAARVSAALRHCLMARGGRLATRARTVTLARAYTALGADGRRRFRDILAHDFAADGASANAAVADLDEFGEWRGLFDRRRVLTVMDSPRRRILRAFQEIPGGTRLLERMRSEVPAPAADATPLADLARDLDEVLGTQFARPSESP